MTVLSIDNLSVSAWGVKLLSEISLQLKAGELISIIGPNGAGKTTLINTLVGAGHNQQLTVGEINICGCSYLHWQPEDRARHVALLPQLNSLSFPFTVNEVIQLGRIPHSTGKTIDNKIINEALNALDIIHLQQRLYTQLSGGEKQRVQLARVMVQIWREEDAKVSKATNANNENNGKRLLLLDEPTSSLDIGHQQQLMKVIRHFADQGVAIIMVAHDINLVMNHADKLLALCCGEVIAQGKPEDIVTSDLMRKLYQVDVDIISHPITHKQIVISN